MAALLISILVFGVALLAMSVGVLFGREPIRGSCGGVAGRCELCSGSCEKRRGDRAAAGEGAE